MSMQEVLNEFPGCSERKAEIQTIIGKMNKNYSVMIKLSREGFKHKVTEKHGDMYRSVMIESDEDIENSLNSIENLPYIHKSKQAM